MLIVGIGNPGEKFAFTRHNAGFLALDSIASVNKFPEFKAWKSSLISQTETKTGKACLLKPMNFVNLSGIAVSEYSNFYKIPVENILVIHDDIDMEPGKIKMKQGGGHGGHNGLKSIDHHVGKNYWRLKIGVGKPEHPGIVADYVLGRFTKHELNLMELLNTSIAELFPLLLEREFCRFASKVSQNLHNFVNGV